MILVKLSLKMFHADLTVFYETKKTKVSKEQKETQNSPSLPIANGLELKAHVK